MTSGYGSLNFWAMREAVRLLSLSVMGMAPPVVANNNSEKRPCPMSTILSWDLRRFKFSFSKYASLVSLILFVGA